jgi:tryptophan halogenase
VYSGDSTDDDDALVALRGAAKNFTGDPSLSRFPAGRRPASWIRNVVALGASTLNLEPLVGADLHFAQLGLGTLVELFPLEPRSTVEAVEYNRIIGEHADALRDFTLAHYLAGPARSGELWSAVRAAKPPATLAEKLDLFSANGRIQLADHESFEEIDWVWLLLGAGQPVQALEWQMQMRVKDISRNDVAPLAQQVEQLVSSMPRHMDYLKFALSQTVKRA